MQDYERLRVPALSMLRLIREPRFGGARWQIGCTLDQSGERLWLAAPGSIESDAPFAVIEGDDVNAMLSVSIDLQGRRFSAHQPNGQSLNLVTAPRWIDPPTRVLPEVHGRTAGALGTPTWLRWSESRIGIVGAGGLGTPLALQLAASGVGSLVICDPDAFELHNLGRLPLSFGEEVIGLPKAEAVGAYLRSARPGMAVEAIVDEFEYFRTFKRFIDCDIIIAACDSALARRSVGRIAARYLIPAISIGTGIFSSEFGDPIVGWEGAVWLPGSEGCLTCHLGLTEEAALRSDKESQMGQGRLGSLASLNLEAIAWASRTIEEIMAMRLMRSYAVRADWDEGVIRLREMPRQRLRDCACPLLAVGDRGF